MDKVYIEKLNSVYVRVHTEPGILMEMVEHYTFKVPGYKFMPAYKNKVWSGDIKLLNSMTGMIYAGLTENIKNFCTSRNYAYELDENLIVKNDVPDDGGILLADEFQSKFVPRDYQNFAVVHALKHNRGLYLSPTASGKSFIIYLTTRFHVENERRVLIVVPTTSLVAQMSKDFVEYNNGNALDIHQIMAGVDKNIKSDWTISTWQSIFKQPRDWFEQFDCIVIDEAHQAKSKSLTKIMEKTPSIEYKYGYTGTLDDSLTHKLVLEGLFGEVVQVTKTKQLIDDGTLSQFRIKALMLKYENYVRQGMVDKSYQEEIDWLVTSQKRNRFIRNLAWSLEGNTLILFTFIEKHGDDLFKLLQGNDRKDVHYIHGNTPVDERERIRALCETTGDNIIAASYGTWSTGINVTNLDNIIFASPYKSKIRNLQSIGRVLRKSDSNNIATLYDIVDDMTWKSHMNFASRHFVQRMKIYSNEGFTVKTYTIEI